MRLLDMGVEDYLLTSSINAVQAQRLVRTLCENCNETYTPIDEVVERWQLDRFAIDGKVTLRRAVGCDHCGRTGYAGRSAILEILIMSNEIKNLIMKKPDANQILEAACASGMATLRDDGFRKAVAGVTTLEEVLRVTPEQADGYVSL